MQLELFRLSSNHLYTHGNLVVNGGQFSNTVEHTLSMLPIGEYTIKLKKVGKSRRKMVIIPVNAKITHHASLITHPLVYSIDAGNSWKDSLAKSKIIIGETNIPGTIIKSQQFCDLLFERIEKSKTPITLHIYDHLCREDKPIQFWLSPSDHDCPPSRQFVDVDSHGNATIYHNNGTVKHLSIEQQLENRSNL